MNAAVLAVECTLSPHMTPTAGVYYVTVTAENDNGASTSADYPASGRVVGEPWCSTLKSTPSCGSASQRCWRARGTEAISRMHSWPCNVFCMDIPPAGIPIAGGELGLRSVLVEDPTTGQLTFSFKGAPWSALFR